MKTVKQLENEKEILQSEFLANYLINKYDFKKRFEINALDTLINYLKTNPTEEFIKKQIEILEESLASMYLNYIPLDPLYNLKETCSKHKREYENLYAVKQKKFQLKYLKYLLS